MAIALDQRVTTTNYSISFSGNDGEEELTIHVSGGQDRRFGLLIVAMEVDGGVKVLHKESRVQDKLLLQTVEAAISKWSETSNEDRNQEILLALKKFLSPDGTAETFEDMVK